ncbi:MAG TPA: hypothetical protein VF753_17805 [Terriglobales bacterium]
MAAAASPSQRRIGFAFAALILVLILLLWRPASEHLRAAGLLMRIQDSEHPGWLAEREAYRVSESATEVATQAGLIRARLYAPEGLSDAPGMVIVHGVHRLGIEEPRLVAFARAMAAGGVQVLTPELASLADYRVEPGAIALIGDSARSFAESLHQKVGVLGISFGGGLALLAAADLQYARYIRFVMTVGAHDDLGRVTEFFVTNRIERPDRSVAQMKANDYGPLVLIYSHAEDFFPPADVPRARNALRLLLWEQPDESKKEAGALSESSQHEMDLIYKGDKQALAGEMQQVVERHQPEMAAVSPHGHLAALQVPVFLLHGAGDNVIPPTELLWLEHEVPHDKLRAALVSPAISHASMEDTFPFVDRLRLVDFMAKVLEAADDRQAVPAQ